MTRDPRISVVMSVYNGATDLGQSISSILAQQGVDFEFIIVDDGSTDRSGSVIDEFARLDSRIRVVHQTNTGLTRALIRGCALARGAYIARQDSGDISLMDRLSTEVAMLDAFPNAALTSCGTRIVGPKEEHLYDVLIPQEEATPRLLALEPEHVRGPYHGSAMFRRDLYERVGGYREQFAQDLDLWTRLAERGEHRVTAAILYQAGLTLGSISSLNRKHQEACKRLIVECARLRRSGRGEEDALAAAQNITPERGRAARYDIASASYFVGMCLRQRGDPRARKYFRQALNAHPMHIKSAIRLLLG
jgi:glycosyltransferase involved in cell wall biosynthesis